MYLIFNKDNKRQFKIVTDYYDLNIPDDWNADIISGKKGSKGERVAQKEKGAQIVLTQKEKQRRGL